MKGQHLSKLLGFSQVTTLIPTLAPGGISPAPGCEMRALRTSLEVKSFLDVENRIFHLFLPSSIKEGQETRERK